MTNSFWTGGPKAYAKGLAEKYEPLLAELKSRLDSSGESNRANLEAKLALVESEYEEKLNSIPDLWF